MGKQQRKFKKIWGKKLVLGISNVDIIIEVYLVVDEYYKVVTTPNGRYKTRKHSVGHSKAIKQLTWRDKSKFQNPWNIIFGENTQRKSEANKYTLLLSNLAKCLVHVYLEIMISQGNFRNPHCGKRSSFLTRRQLTKRCQFEENGHVSGMQACLVLGQIILHYCISPTDLHMYRQVVQGGAFFSTRYTYIIYLK